MCRTVDNGGRRCTQSSTTQARRALAQRLKRHQQAGKTTQAAADAASLARFDLARDHYGNTVTPMLMDLPVSVYEVFKVLREAGYRSLVVGGSVRDALTDGRAPKDIDVEVYGATIDNVLETLRQRYRVDEVGKSFGVLKVVLGDGTDLDVSVPRRDNHVGAGHRGFTIDTDTTMAAQEAATRRDYTINAMGYDPELHVCVDPWGGRADLHSRTLTATSEAFAEDPLRVLRGFQFAARYGYRFDDDTAATCRSLVPRATEIPVERVRSEWRKFYTKGVDLDAGMQALEATGWRDTIPGLAEVDTPRLRDHLTAGVALAERDDLTPAERERLIAAIIARPMGGTTPDGSPLVLDSPQRKAFLFHTIEGSDQQRSAKALAEATYPSLGSSDHLTRAFAHTLGAKGTSIREWARLQQATGTHAGHAKEVAEQAQRLGCYDSPQPDLILGRDIIARFPDLRPGPWTGAIQRAARTAQIEGDITTPAQAARWLQHHPGPPTTGT